MRHLSSEFAQICQEDHVLEALEGTPRIGGTNCVGGGGHINDILGRKTPESCFLAEEETGGGRIHWGGGNIWDCEML